MPQVEVKTTRTYHLTLSETEALALQNHLRNTHLPTKTVVRGADPLADIYLELRQSIARHKVNDPDAPDSPGGQEAEGHGADPEWKGVTILSEPTQEIPLADPIYPGRHFTTTQ